MSIKLLKLTKKPLQFVLLFTTLILTSYGCSSIQHLPTSTYNGVPQGLINTSDVKIEAVDGSFVLKSGETFNTPFSSNRSVWWSSNPPKSGSFQDCVSTNSCVKVRVTVPKKDKPLYGYINFSDVHPSATGPGSRSYYIEIPQRYVDEASRGRVSVVYEWVSVKRTGQFTTVNGVGYYDRNTGDKQAGWVLWLSDRPF